MMDVGSTTVKEELATAGNEQSTKKYQLKTRDHHGQGIHLDCFSHVLPELI